MCSPCRAAQENMQAFVVHIFTDSALQACPLEDLFFLLSLDAESVLPLCLLWQHASSLLCGPFRPIEPHRSELCMRCHAASESQQGGDLQRASMLKLVG